MAALRLTSDGLTRPANGLSRGCSAGDIVAASAVAALPSIAGQADVLGICPACGIVGENQHGQVDRPSRRRRK